MEAILKAFSVYGIPTVVLAIIIFLLIIFVKKWINKYFLTNDKIKHILLETEKKKQEIDIQNHILQYDLDLAKNVKINGLLSELLYSMRGSGRVCIFMMHNGGVMKSGFGLLKFSAIFSKRKNKSKIPEAIGLWKDVPISILTTFLNILEKDGTFNMYTENVEIIDCALYNILIEQDILQMISYPLFDDNGMIGWVSVAFEDKMILDVTDLKATQDISRSINLHLI